MTTRLIQLQQGSIRKVGLIEEPRIRLLSDCASIYELACAAINANAKLSKLARQWLSAEWLNYDEVYAGASEWRILPAADHPEETARCLVTGTGLTHTASAKNRNAMHAQSDNLTDSMKMFQWGIAGGRPAENQIGVAPEWFYKGSGSVLRAHGEALLTPSYAEDGGEEPEVAGIYLIGPDAQPYRIGFAVGNEFSDHQFEKRNYLYLAGSKLRNCAIGPELVLDHAFQSVPGVVSIERDGHTLWSHEIKTGDAEMCHSLRNIEHHHFKFEGHRRPGDLHVHSRVPLSDWCWTQHGRQRSFRTLGGGWPVHQNDRRCPALATNAGRARADSLKPVLISPRGVCGVRRLDAALVRTPPQTPREVTAVCI